MGQEASFFSRLGMISIEEFSSVSYEEMTFSHKLKFIAACIAVKEYTKATAVYTSLSCPSELSIDDEKLLHAIEFRLFKKESESTRIFRWQKMYMSTKVDMKYPEQIQAISFEKDAILEDICPCCMTSTKLSTTGCCVSIAKPGSSFWLCPHCLAQREWHYENVRQILWDYFTEFFNKLKRNEKGELSIKDVNVVSYIVLALAPLALIRFGYLETEAIGHLLINPTLYIAMKSRGLMPASLDFLGCSSTQGISNTYLVEKWKEVLELDSAAGQMAMCFRGTKMHLIELTKYAAEFYYDYDAFNGIENIVPFSFTLKEHCKARAELEKMGIPKHAPFVVLHVRDDSYDEKVRPHEEERLKLIRNRNSDIDNYRLVAEYLASQGYYVIRTGHIVRKPIEWAQNRIIDYAVHHRSEFMDVWLFAHCAFCISTASGPSVLPAFFNRPSIFTDLFAPVDTSYFSMGDFLALPKAYMYPENSRRVTCAEYAQFVLKKDKATLASLQYLQNTPEEILTSTKEKLALIHGQWETSALLEKLQDRYDKIILALSMQWNKNAYRGHAKLSKFKSLQRVNRISSLYLLADYAQECENNGGAIDLETLPF